MDLLFGMCLQSVLCWGIGPPGSHSLRGTVGTGHTLLPDTGQSSSWSPAQPQASEQMCYLPWWRRYTSFFVRNIFKIFLFQNLLSKSSFKIFFSQIIFFFNPFQNLLFEFFTKSSLWVLFKIFFLICFSFWIPSKMLL